jgi:transcriptional regulator with XRE-family HTH domain
MTPELLGTRIAQALKTSETSRERAADEIGRSRDTLDRYIRGQKNPSAIDVWKISQLTGVPFGWFGLNDDAVPAVPVPAADPPADTPPTPRPRRRRGA